MPTITALPQLSPPLQRLLRVGIYCRVSSTHSEQLASLSGQISYLAKMVLWRPGWLLADIYTDFVSAATGSNRPEYNRLLQDCRDKKIDMVITKGISRFDRDILDLLTSIRELRALGIEVMFEQERISTKEENGELVISILEAYIQAECESRSKNTRWGLEQGAKNGTSGLYKRRCFGYYTDKNGDLQIKADEAAVVCRIFELYLRGESLVGIIRQLSTDGVKSPTGKDRWSKNAIDKLLSNEKYAGRVMLFKTFSAKLLDPVAAPKTNPNKGEFGKYLMTENHPVIIPEEVFEEVQAEKTRRTNIEKTSDGRRRRETHYSVKRDTKRPILSTINTHFNQ